MDSRLREIEQWVLDAKSDLSARGQEAYIRKLFLLDAEIKAVIRESGLVPEAYSPGLREKRVRRFSTPVLATAASLGVLLLTTTAVLTSLTFSNPRPMQFNLPQRLLALFQPHATALVETSNWRASGFVPVASDGTGVLLASYAIGSAADNTPNAGPPPPGLPSTQPPFGLASPARTPSAPAVAGAVKPTPAYPLGQNAAGVREHDATEVQLLAQVPGAAVASPQPQPSGQPAYPRSGVAAPPSESGMRGEIARYERFAEFPDYTPEEPVINDAKMEMDRLMGVGTNSLVDNVDNSESADQDSDAAHPKPAAKTKKSVH